tara:strand:+ start:208 stop:1011 length:804 start_codon:yes stop_codon:yes gene_type:complete
MIDRQEFAEELVLRESIRKIIKIVLEKRKREEKQQLNEEKELRSIIRKLIITEAAEISDETPHENTGINVLEDLLKKIIPVIETDYKILTTAEEQKQSFRAHVVKGIKNALAPSRAVANLRGSIKEAELRSLEEEDEDIDITIGDDEGPNLGDEAFIDIDPDPKPEDEEDDFSIEGEDETGRNMAASTFKKIEKNILDSYELLANSEDRELFYDYLITNIKLYFDKFDDEMKMGLEEPTTPEYDEATAESPEEFGAPEGEEELELEL